MNLTFPKDKIILASPGFLTLEVLLGATAFAAVASLVWGLVWNGIRYLNEAKRDLKTIRFLTATLPTSDFTKDQKEITVKEFQDSIFKASLNVEKFNLHPESNLKNFSIYLKCFKFSAKEPIESYLRFYNQTELVGFFPQEPQQEEKQ